MRLPSPVASVVVVLLLTGALQAQLAEREWGKTVGGYRIHPMAQHLEGLPLGPFGRVAGGGLIAVEDSPQATQAIISRDEGRTWQKVAIFRDPKQYQIRYERALLCTREGTVIVAFMNDVQRSGWEWNPELHDAPDARLPTCVVRSLDGGRSWDEPQTLHTEWTGAIRDMIQTRDGTVVFTSQMLLHHPGRHATVTYASADQGISWRRSNILDLGGIGHHDGVIEATIVQRRDDVLWMLMRTNWGKLWQATSDDGGVHWHPIGPASLDASSAPPILHRLSSGRLLLAWNRFYYHGTTDYPPYGGDLQRSGTSTSNNRQELSIAFSEDDGRTWSEPEVVATVLPDGNGRYRRGEISYPYVFEPRPGEIWLTAWRGVGLRIQLRERDWVEGN